MSLEFGTTSDGRLEFERDGAKLWVKITSPVGTDVLSGGMVRCRLDAPTYIEELITGLLEMYPEVVLPGPQAQVIAAVEAATAEILAAIGG